MIFNVFTHDHLEALTHLSRCRRLSLVYCW
uniref:Uncharacterized protein n=1 Tax=Arundo donax TaxID=35708 RepID=A0A0A9FEG7_ARUDO